MSNVSAKKVFIQIESAEEQQVRQAASQLASLQMVESNASLTKEHLRGQRKTLKVLQSAATDKENFAGRQKIDTLSRLKAAADVTLATVEHAKRKKIETRSIETQTSPKKHNDARGAITAEDLTSTAKPGEHYFEKLAEKRRKALETTLNENRSLHERIEGLEEELNTTRKLLDESRSLVEVLTEMLNENESGEEDHPGETINDDDSDTRSSIETAAAVKDSTENKNSK